jgi:integrase
MGFPLPKPNKSGVARYAIPADVREEYQRLYGKRREERWRSPPGMSAGQCKRLYSEWVAEISGRIEAIRAAKQGNGIDLSYKEGVGLAGEWYRWFIGKHETDPGDPKSWDFGFDWLVDKMLERAPEEVLENGMMKHPGWDRDPEVRAHVRPFIAEHGDTAQFLASRGIALTNTARTLFLDCVADNILMAFRLLERRALGDYSPDELPARFPPFTLAVRQNTDAQATINGGTSPWKLFEAWQAARQPAERTIERWRTVLLDLEHTFAGPNAQPLTEDTAQTWAKSKITEDRSAQTVRATWVNAAHTVYAWAKSERMIRSNPFADVSVTVPKKISNRESKAFTADEARTILRAALAVDDRESPLAAAKRWVPWISSYSGARAGELTQLRGQDIEQRDDVWVMRIRPDAGPVKTGQARTVPLHTDIIDQGFLDYVRRRGQGPLFHDPDANDVPHDPMKPKMPRSVEIRSAIAKWVRSLGITDKEVSPNHGWRHTFKQIGHRHEITERLLDAIVGHSPLNVSRRYGPPTLSDMATALKKFPRYEV